MNRACIFTQKVHSISIDIFQSSFTDRGRSHIEEKKNDT